MNNIHFHKYLLLISLVLSACGGGGGSGDGDSSGAGAGGVVENIQVSGQVTFDRVPFNASGQGLNYNAIQVLPAREVSIQAVDASGGLLTTGKTDESGNYSITIPSNINSRIEVLAELSETDPALNWLTRVVDAVGSNNVYVLQGALINSGTQNQVRNLHADSGWTGASYTNERASAPFAILDSIYRIYEKLSAENVSLSMPELEIRWGEENSAGSFYNGSFIEIAGGEDLDTDEFDEHIIVHEWRHYYEREVSRGDTIGGSHGLTSRLELRTAYSEGVGNAWSGFILDDPIYKDSLGAGQSTSFQFNMETSAIASEGFYIENSIQEIVYDILDTNNEGVDSVTIPLQTMIEAWQSNSYMNQESLTSIYSLREALEEVSPATSVAVDTLYNAEDIQGNGNFGDGETNGAGLSLSLPIYQNLTIDAAPIEVCSDNAVGEFNRLENRQLIRFEVDIFGSGLHTVTVTRGPNNTNWNPNVPSDPDFVVYSRGDRRTLGLEGRSSENNTETWTGILLSGEFVIELYDFNNIDNQAGTGGLTCFDISVTEN